MANRLQFGLMGTSLSLDEAKRIFTEKLHSFILDEYREPFMTEQFVENLINNNTRVTIHFVNDVMLPENSVFPLASINFRPYEGAPFYDDLVVFFDTLSDKRIMGLKIFPFAFFNAEEKFYRFLLNAIHFLPLG